MKHDVMNQVMDWWALKNSSIFLIWILDLLSVNVFLVVTYFPRLLWMREQVIKFYLHSHGQIRWTYYWLLADGLMHDKSVSKRHVTIILSFLLYNLCFISTVKLLFSFNMSICKNVYFFGLECGAQYGSDMKILVEGDLSRDC